MCKFFPMSGPHGVAALLFVGLVFHSGSASAQNIFSNFFGFGVAPKQPPAVAPLRRGVRPDGVIWSAPRRTQPRASYRGRYRTLCVRLCDGYYFPISQAASRRHFYRDAEACQARCQGETRLFYTPSQNPDMKRAVDISGLAYRNLDTAFVYRKKLVKGCSCRLAPWSPQERARHAMYRSLETDLEEPETETNEVIVGEGVKPPDVDGAPGAGQALPETAAQFEPGRAFGRAMGRMTGDGNLRPQPMLRPVAEQPRRRQALGGGSLIQGQPSGVRPAQRRPRKAAPHKPTFGPSDLLASD